jgi:hypothetical protein
MSLADELQKLDDLRRRGTLTAAEFERAKAALLAGDSADVGGHLADQLAEVRHQNDLAQIDREWEIERQQYLVTGKHGRQFVPTTGTGLMSAVGGGAFGIFWTVMAVSIMSGAPTDGAFGAAKVFFPLFGVVFTLIAIGWGVYCYLRAQKYDAAFQAYQDRRGRAARG